MESDGSSEPNNETLFQSIHIVHKPMPTTKDKYFEYLDSIKDIEYLFGMIVALVAVYLGVWLVHLALFKLGNKTRSSPVSPLLAQFYLFKERLLTAFGFIICIFATSKFLHFGLIVKYLMFTVVVLIGIIRMLAETYTILISLFAITKYFNHFYSGNVQLTTNFWRCAVTNSCWFVGFRDLVFVFFAFLVYLNRNEERGAQLFLYFSGVQLSSQLLLFLAAVLYTQMFWTRRKPHMSNSYMIMCAQTVLLATVKNLLIPLLVFFDFAGVQEEILLAMFILSDILLVPMIVQLSDILFAFTKPMTTYEQEEINMEEMLPR